MVELNNPNEMNLTSLKNKSFNFVLQGIILLIFCSISFGLVFSRGVCCADDAFYSMLAKNLAGGLSWSTTLQADKAHFKLLTFGPSLPAGPTIIFPAALVIRLTGNTYWAPGVAMVSVLALLLIFLVIYLNRISKSEASVTLALLVFLGFAYLFMAFHFAQWYALLGEIPAALLIIIALLIYIRRDSYWSFFLVGFLFSLATLSKILALLPFCSFLGALVLYYLMDLKLDWARWKPVVKQVIIMVCSFMLPIVLFEIWKLSVLGIREEMQYWVDFVPWFMQHSLGSVQVPFANKITQGNQTLISRFGLSAAALPFLFLFGGFLARNDKKIFKLLCILFVVIITLSVYWFLFSIGWARYYIIALTLILFALTLPFLAAQKNLRHLLVYGFLLMLFSASNWNRALFPIQNDGARLFSPSASTRALLEVKAWLSSHMIQRPFITQWWATAADIEYILDSSLNFTTYRDPNLDLKMPFILVVNTKFLDSGNQTFMNLMERCDVHYFEAYVIGECHGEPN